MSLMWNGDTLFRGSFYMRKWWTPLGGSPYLQAEHLNTPAEAHAFLNKSVPKNENYIWKRYSKQYFCCLNLWVVSPIPHQWRKVDLFSSLIHEGKGALLGDAPLVEQWQQNPQSGGKKHGFRRRFSLENKSIDSCRTKIPMIIIWLLKSMPNIWVNFSNSPNGKVRPCWDSSHEFSWSN